jgi:hypothetical protein
MLCTILHDSELAKHVHKKLKLRNWVVTGRITPLSDLNETPVRASYETEALEIEGKDTEALKE